MFKSRLTTLAAALGLTAVLAAPVAALGHPEHVQKTRDDGPAGVEIGFERNNPKGANGTIKIDGVDADGFFDGHPNNEPHIGGCVFQVDFYGFDEDDEGSLRFRHWPGTGSKGELAVMGWVADDPEDDDEPFNDAALSMLDVENGTTLVGIDVGGDGAGGGTDIDQQVYVQLDLPLDGEHPKHGFHVRVDAEIDTDGRTYKKSKVFWVSGDCEDISVSS